MRLIEYPDAAQMMTDVAAILATALEQALAVKSQVSFAVPGGSTPGPVFDALSGFDFDWSRVHVLLTDERWVPETHAQSNGALIRKRLLTGKASAAHFTPYFTAQTNIDVAAKALSSTLSAMRPIDVLLLGMGADMHTASLFPGSADLDAALEPDAPMVLPMASPVAIAGQDVIRITLTAPVLRGAHHTHLLITGAAKRAALEQAISLPEIQAPVNTVLPNATVHWSAS